MKRYKTNKECLRDLESVRLIYVRCGDAPLKVSKKAVRVELMETPYDIEYYIGESSNGIKYLLICEMLYKIQPPIVDTYPY
ncbi:hypothetical protein [Bacteroides sp. 519]|uniref:hypothetical protein n=1 Tax=Bacteroides sp. 519 TaxID=2302937 RepID=UPI0013D1F1E5|nr:hypothetical protein [Bacteroides sp. 519]NDV59323.1 hypothetical protein [Bacteroides sp. 519]